MPAWFLAAWAEAANFVKQNGAAFLADFLLTALLAYPLYAYVRFVWQQKADEISTSLQKAAKQTYLRVFQQVTVSQDKAPARFDAYYRKWYGRNRLVSPIILVLLVAGAENFILAQALLKLSASSTVIDALSASIAGAYTFVTWNFFALVQRRSLLIGDIMRGGLRLAIAVPLGLALAGLNPANGAFLAFAVGVFPLDTISTILRQLANKYLKLELGATNAPSQISQLDGVDASIADRIADADITTIAELAWCDPIDLTMRTNLHFGYIIDIVSQALAWVYLEAKLNTLRPFGLRGAFEICSFMRDDLQSKKVAERTEAQAVLTAAAAAVGLTVEGLQYAFTQIAGDTSTDFLYKAG